jgi:nitrate reductase NapAB chaperone NapD
MPVSGLVVSLKSDLTLREEAIAAIRKESRIEVGVIEGRRMAIVIDTTSTDDDKQLWCWLAALPGVTFVDVAMVGFEDQDDDSEANDGVASATPPCNDLNSV